MTYARSAENWVLLLPLVTETVVTTSNAGGVGVVIKEMTLGALTLGMNYLHKK